MPLGITEIHRIKAKESASAAAVNDTCRPHDGHAALEPVGYFYKEDAEAALPLLLDNWKEKLQVIYMDPPFSTGQAFRFQQRIGAEGWCGNNKYILAHHAYSDKWENRESFLDMLRQVLTCSRELLKPDGSIFLHLDYRFSSYARILMDEIFGAENLLNEIIWTYKSGGRAKNHFSRKHDTILFYRKTDKNYFNLDAVGKPRGTAKRNNMKKQVDEDGRTYWSIRTNCKEYRYYEDSKVYPSDVWDDISHLQQKDPERTGYDTQKPEALLERIIKCASRPGDWIGDFFAGSGTTLAVAQKTGRRWLGMDNSDFSLIVTRKRLLQPFINPDGLLHSSENGTAECIRDGSIYIGDPSVKIEEFHSGCRVKLDIIHRSQTETELRLAGYQCRQLPEITDFLDYIDYWSAGKITGGVFVPEQYSFRSAKSPKLQPILTVSENKYDRTAVHIIDIYGEQSMIVI